MAYGARKLDQAWVITYDFSFIASVREFVSSSNRPGFVFLGNVFLLNTGSPILHCSKYSTFRSSTIDIM